MGQHKSKLYRSDNVDITPSEIFCLQGNEYQKLLADSQELRNIKGIRNNGIGSRIANRENYQCPCGNDLTLKDTGIPQTSEKTKKFQMANDIRSPYDRYWLNIYNNHAKNENYSL